MKKCEVCQKQALARGLCQKHYDAARRSGRLEISRLKSRSIKERLEQYSRLKVDTGCIEWFGDAHDSGYGKIWLNGRTELAHRASWEEANKQSIPEGLCVLHKCDNPACINPEHLFLGTDADNVADMDAKGRRVISRGEKIWGAKLKEADIPLILNDGRTQREIAADYGVSQSLIGLIKRGEIWRHVA